MIPFKKNKVLIIGDIMVDHYIYGEIHRQSPEAPVPVIDQKEKASHLGGAANVALNILGLEGVPTLIGLIGEDQEGSILLQLLAKHGINSTTIIKDGSRKTTSKTRIIADDVHVARIDHEDTHSISSNNLEAILAHINHLSDDEVDVAILQDYNKGIFSAKSIAAITQLLSQKNIPFVVDPKEAHFFDFKGAALFKPNINELRTATKKKLLSNEEIKDQIKGISQQLKSKIILITMGSKGLIAYQDGQFIEVDAELIEHPDVCGAGDAVISLSALAFANQLELSTLAKLANRAGALACRQIGVNPIRLNELK